MLLNPINLLLKVLFLIKLLNKLTTDKGTKFHFKQSGTRHQLDTLLYCWLSLERS